MNKNNDEIIKERRNFLFLSLLLIVNFFHPIKFEELSFLGSKGLVGNTDILLILVVSIWVYFFMRYYQGVISIKGFSNISSSFHEKLNFYSQEPIKNSLSKEGVEQAEDIGFIQKTSLEKKNLFTYLYPFGEVDHITGMYMINRNEEIRIYKFFLAYIKSIIYVLFKTRHITEYILPFIIGMISAILIALEFFLK